MINVYEKLLFCPINFPPPPAEIVGIFDEIPYDRMKEDVYRNCFHIPILTSDYKWTEFSDLVPELKLWLEEHIFDWCYGKIMVITTPPGALNPLHIDCAPHEMFTPQHKFRVVLQGETSTLKFVTKNGDMSVPNIDRPFIMSGNWPHYMHNQSDKRKYTIAIGKPWLPSINNARYRSILDDGMRSFEPSLRSFDSYDDLPKDYYLFFEKRYNVTGPLKHP
jgi:hypothetical protein